MKLLHIPHSHFFHQARGKHQNNKSFVKPPFILGLEFSGAVISAPKTSKLSIGDHVFGSGLGAYASRTAVQESSLRLIPPGWDFKSAAGLAATAPVSYGALIIRGGLKRGETILIHAAAGGLGLMAIQIAKAAGATVIATASSGEKLEVARQFGADKCVIYSGAEQWWRTILTFTNRKGVDLVFDSVGLVEPSLKCLGHGGRILVIGFAGREGNLESVAMNKVLLKQASVIGYRSGETDRRNPEETRRVWSGLEGLESVVSALEDLSARQAWGKAVVTIKQEVREAKL